MGGGFAFSISVVPGKEELDRSTLDEMLGARRDEYEAALRDAGITRQAIWHQETPAGTVAVVYVEGDDPEAAVAQFGSSDEPLNAWFRDQQPGKTMLHPPPRRRCFVRSASGSGRTTTVHGRGSSRRRRIGSLYGASNYAKRRLTLEAPKHA